jgi:hypothetical protein
MFKQNAQKISTFALALLVFLGSFSFFAIAAEMETLDAFQVQMNDTSFQDEMREYYQELYPEYDFTGYVFIQGVNENLLSSRGIAGIETFSSTWTYTTWISVFSTNLFLSLTIGAHPSSGNEAIISFTTGFVPNFIVTPSWCSYLELEFRHRILPGLYCYHIFLDNGTVIIDRCA